MGRKAGCIPWNKGKKTSKWTTMLMRASWLVRKGYPREEALTKAQWEFGFIN